MKICSKCKISKEIRQFGNHSKSRDKLKYYCKSCEKENNTKWYKANTDKNRAKAAKWAKENPEKNIKKAARWNKENSTKHNLHTRVWQKKNPSKINAIAAKYRATKFKASPKWLTKEQLTEIEEFYILAKELQWLSEKPLEVDHIVPLQGKNVSGLHVPWNLQILSEPTNRSKGNRI